MTPRMKEMRDRSTDELRKSERELYDKLFKLRFQLATGQAENPGRISMARRELARVKTVLRERREEAEKTETKES